MQIHRYAYKMTIFYLCEQINLSVVQIILCLSAKKWDRCRYAFAKHCLSLCQIVAKLYVEAFSCHHHHPPPQNHPNHFCFQLREVTPILTSIGAIVFAGTAHVSNPTPQGSPFVVFFLGYKMMQNLACLLIF